MADPLGRTNREFPRVWLRLEAPSSAVPGQVEDLARAAHASGAPIDISSAPALWGGLLRDREDLVLIQNSALDLERATGGQQAADLVQAHLIETLSALSRPRLDFYFLRSRKPYTEAQISGALETLESARQDGHIAFVGLYAEGSAESTLANWNLHDGFEVLSYEEGRHEDLLTLAKQRRVGLVRRGAPSDRNETVLVPVGSSHDVERALRPPVGSPA